MLPVRRAGNMWMVHMKRNPAVGLLGKNAGATTVVIPNRTIIEIFQQMPAVLNPSTQDHIKKNYTPFGTPHGCGPMGYERTEHGWEDWHVDWLYYLKWAVFGYFWLPLFFNIFYQYSIHPRGGPRDERYFDPNLGGHAYVWKGHSILLGDYIEKNIYGDAIPYKPNIKDVRTES